MLIGCNKSEFSGYFPKLIWNLDWCEIKYAVRLSKLNWVDCSGWKNENPTTWGVGVKQKNDSWNIQRESFYRHKEVSQDTRLNEISESMKQSFV